MNSPTPAPAGEARHAPINARPIDMSVGDENYVELTATWGAMQVYGIGGPELGKKRSFEERITVTAADGHAWEVWCADGFFVEARRARTPEERDRFIDARNERRFSGFFSLQRQEAVSAVGRSIADLGERILSGAQPMKRKSDRDAAAELLCAAGVVLSNMASCRELDMAAMRESLADVGIEVPALPALH